MHHLSREEWIGYLCLFGGVALFSTIEVGSKIIGLAVDPLVLTFLRFSVTGLVLTGAASPVLSARRQPLQRQDYKVFLLNGFLAVVLAIPLFHWAVVTLDKAASAAVIFSVNPVFVMFLGRFINDEPWTRRGGIAGLCGACGILFFAFETGRLEISSLFGLGLMLVSALLFAGSTCLAKRYVKQYGALLLMGGSALAGCLLLLPLVAWKLWQSGTGGILAAWPALLYVSLAGTALAYFLYYYGLMNTMVQTGSMMFFLKPVLASVFAAVLLREAINRYMLAGTVLILVGLTLAVYRPRSRVTSGENSPAG